MATENGNSSIEMATSDQVLVATKRKRKLTYIIGAAVMVAFIALIVTLSVVLTGGDSVADLSTSTTEGTTSPGIPSPETTTTTTEPPPTDDNDGSLDLNDIIEGVYAPPSFNATWVTGGNAMFKNTYGDLLLYNVEEDEPRILIRNTSEILQKSSRVASLSADGDHVVLSYDVIPGYRYSFLARYTVVKTTAESDGNVHIVPEDLPSEEAFLQNFVWGPVGTALAFVYTNNVYYQASLTEKSRKISTTGEVTKIYNGIPDWVYEEEVFSSNNAIWFSKDGNKLAYATFNDSRVEIMLVPHYGVHGPNYQYTQHPKIRYPKTGTVNPTVTVTLYDVLTNISTVYEGPSGLSEPILKAVTFVNNNEIAVLWTNRVQTTLKVLLCSNSSTTCNEIYDYTETPNGWIDNIPLIFNEAGNSFITILPQSVNSTLYKQIVQVSQGSGDSTGTWTASNRINTPHTVIDIMHWSTSDIIWYKATNAADTAEQHIYTVNPTREVECFSCDIQKENGQQCLYNDGSINTDGSRVAVNCAGPSLPQIFIYNTNGSRVRVWDDSDALSANLEGAIVPEVIYQTVTIPGGPTADVLLQVPPGYQNSSGLPLLVYVYAGPDTALVTKQWNIDWGSYLVSKKKIAVAHIDGRGSGLRGVENMFSLYKKLGTLEIADQIHVTKELQQNTWIDEKRTCIWGWSYGGYAATKALAEGGDVFRCAAAVAPVVDWRFYDTIYTERYMDIPSANSEGYTESSLLKDNVVNALRNKSYFLIHGTADDNVHYQHAMLLSRLLQRNDVYFTQMSYTDEDHGLVEVRPHLYHALEKFLVEHML